MIKDILRPGHNAVKAYIGKTLVWERFKPSDLFANGDQGVWYDPSDLSTMFQDVNGMTPVTNPGDPVGLILDKSQGLETTEISLPSDYKDMKMPFVVGYGTEENNIEILEHGLKLKFSGDTRSYIRFSRYNRDVGFVKGRLYRISVFISEMQGKLSNNAWNFSLYQSASDSSRVSGLSPQLYKLGWNSFTVRIAEDADWNSVIRFPLNSVEKDAYVVYSKFKIEEIRGNHAIQSSAALRPIYQSDGNLHWLEFDGVDDSLYSNQYPRKTPQNVVISASRTNTNQIYLTGTAYNHSIFTSIVATNNYLGMSGSVGEITDPAIFKRAPTANIVHALWNNEKSYVFLNGNTFERGTAPVSPTDVKGIGIGVASATWFANKLAGNVYQVVSFEGITNIEDSLKIRRYVSNKAGTKL